MMPSHRTGTGETLTTLTTSHGPRINTSQSTADHAGLKVPPQPLLTDLTSSSEITTQLQLASQLKLLLTAKLVEAATVETQVVSTTMPTTLVSLIPVVNNTLLRISLLTNANQLIFAEIVKDPLQHGTRLVKKTAKL